MDQPDASVHLRAAASAPARPLAARRPLVVVWAGALGARASLPVLAGGLDDALARVAPRVTAHVPGLGDAVVVPTALGDLRPGRIARSLPAVRALQELARLDAQGAGPDALAASGAPADWVRRALDARRDAAGPASAVDRLMGMVGPAEPASLADAVAAEVSRVEAALEADADRSALERSWRGLGWLTRRLDLRGDVRLVAVSDGSVDALLNGDALAQAAASASLVIADVEVGPSAVDVERAGRLAALGASAGVPVIASAAPELVGAEGRHGAVPPVRHGDRAAFAGWVGLRSRPEARALAVAYPPVRLAAGRDVWGGAALAVAADAARAWAAGDGLSSLGRRPVPDLDADALAVALPPEVAADLARAGVVGLVPEGPGVRVASAPSAAATSGPPARDAALSLPAALFAARLARVAEGAGDLRAALERELDPWGRVEATPDGLRAVLPAGAAPPLAADVAVTLRPGTP